MDLNFILFDDARREDLLPLTFTRPVADIRIGISTIREKWEHFLGKKTSSLTEPYMAKKFPTVFAENNILINGALIPNEKLVKQILELKPNQSLICGDIILASHMESSELNNIEEAAREDAPEKADIEEAEEIEYDCEAVLIRYPWEIFSRNGEMIKSDFEYLTKGRKSQAISETNRVLCPENVFVEEGARLEFATINASAGPVYIGKDAEIMEGSVIRGPFAMREHAVVKMAAKIYGPTTLGPWCKVGGELNNCVLFGYSNKAHDGFIGNAVIGEWCNLGADTNNSNLKNTYDDVKIWNYPLKRFISSGLQFCGLIMGDHSKCGINTMFNTGTVVGVNANIYGSGFQRVFVPSFAWGSNISGFSEYNIDKALRVAERVFSRRNLELTEGDREILVAIHDMTFNYRRM